MLQHMPNNAVQPRPFADNAALARNKTPTPRLTPRVKAAVDAMVEHGLELDQAAAETGLTTRAIRLAFERPHVLAYYRQQCDVLRTSTRARNIHRLRAIRDAENNMPAVNAIKALEQLADEQTNNKQTTTPGVTIRIVNVTATPAQHQQTIDATSVQPDE